MYLDRVSLSQVADLIRADLELEEAQVDWVLGVFFWTYALGQVPAGWLGARFGHCRVLAGYLLLWSAFTALTGAAGGFLALLLTRLGMGLAQAGGYPTAAAIIAGWFPTAARGRASSAVAPGGRLGWALAQLATPPLGVAPAPASPARRPAVLPPSR